MLATDVSVSVLPVVDGLAKLNTVRFQEEMARTMNLSLKASRCHRIRPCKELCCECEKTWGQRGAALMGTGVAI